MRRRAGEDAVSDVVGSVMLVGITILIMAGFSVVVLSVEPPGDELRTQLSFSVHPGTGGWGTGDEIVRVEHRGGHAWPADTARILVLIDSSLSTFAAGNLSGPFSDGELTIGEVWQATFTISESAQVNVDAVDDARGHLFASARLQASAPALPGGGGGGGGSTNASHFYVNGHTAVSGTVSDFDALRSDSPAAATLQEAAAATLDRYATTHTSSGGTQDPEAAIGVPDGSHAVLRSNNDRVEVGGFATGSGGITSVSAVIQVHKAGILVNDDVRVQARLGTGSWVTLANLDVTSSDVDYVLPFTKSQLGGSGAWSWTDVQSLQLRAQYAKVAANDLVDFHVDSLWLRIGQGAQDLNVELRFPVIVGSDPQLQIRYAATGDTFAVQVWSGTGWNTRGAVLDATSMTVWTYDLSPTEVTASGGTPLIRIIDPVAGGTGSLSVDYARVVVA